MRFLFFILLLFPALDNAQAKSNPNADYDRQNENIGLDTSPTATRIQDIEMILGAIYSIEDQVSLSAGSEELANRSGNSNEKSKRSSHSGSSSNR